MKNFATLIESKENEIRNEIKDCFAASQKCFGAVWYSLYIAEDGELQTVEQTGASGWYPVRKDGTAVHHLIDVKAEMDKADTLCYYGNNAIEDEDDRAADAAEALIEEWECSGAVDSKIEEIYNNAE